MAIPFNSLMGDAPKSWDLHSCDLGPEVGFHSFQETSHLHRIPHNIVQEPVSSMDQFGVDVLEGEKCIHVFFLFSFEDPLFEDLSFEDP